MWQTVAENMERYRNYPRIVGETGGKDFIVAHPSADVDALATAIVRGSFEYQGQKCSAASRVYAPSNLWPELRERLAGAGRDDQDRRRRRLPQLHGRRDRRELVRDAARGDRGGEGAHEDTEIVVGGGNDDSQGLLRRADGDRDARPGTSGCCATSSSGRSSRPTSTTRSAGTTRSTWSTRTAPYGLTGAVFAEDRAAVAARRSRQLRYAAGNFYVNDKPTGAVVGQQPFGGARASGTNDKAGSMWNLIRWVSPRTIKETLHAADDYRYPFMDADARRAPAPLIHGDAGRSSATAVPRGRAVPAPIR